MLGSNHTVQVSVKVLDQATDPLKRISDRTKQMSKDFQSIGTSLGAFSNKMGSLTSGLDKMANSMYRFNMYTSSIQRNLKAMAVIGVGAAAALGVSAANSAIDFEFKSTKMQTKMNASKSTRDEISKYILDELNYIVRYKPTEIADLGIILGQAGISNKEEMKSLLKDTAYFAEAVDAVPAEAGQMLIATLKGFDMDISRASEASDRMSYALTKSLLQVEELPHALGQLAGRAKMYGQTLDSSLIALMVAADQGMPSAQASQNLLFGLRQLTQVGNEDFAQPRRIQYYRKGGIDMSFFDEQKRQIKEYPEIIESLEKSLFNLGWMPNKEHFDEVVALNQGRIPEGLIDKMMAMPMIQRVFGAAGQTPLVMGLQARYEEVDKETGLSTGTVLYGSEALKRMRQEMQNATGLTADLHAEMEQTVQFNLGVLSGAWESSKIKIANDFLPVIKTGALELVNYLGGDVTRAAQVTGMSFDASKAGIDRFNDSLKAAAANARQTSPYLADLIELLGDLATSSVKIGSSLTPTFEQIGKSAKDNLIDKEWGDSLLSLPYHAVQNGFDFIQDVMAGNEASDKKIANLPPELQDRASLTKGLIQGSVVLVAAGAIVKIIELAFRAASASVKTGKIAFDVSMWLIDILGGAKKTGKSPLPDAMKTMTVTASVVNVYGAVSGVGGKPGGPVPVPTKPGETTTPKRTDTYGKGGGGSRLLGLGRLLGIAGVGYSAASGDMTGVILAGLLGGPVGAAISLLTLPAILSANRSQEMSAERSQNIMDAYALQGIEIPQNTRYDEFNIASGNYIPKNSIYDNLTSTEKKNLLINGVGNGPPNLISNEAVNSLSGYLNSVKDDNFTAIAQGFTDFNKSLENVKIENSMNMQFNPIINITGELKDKLSNIETTITDDQVRGMQNWLLGQNRRYDE